MDRIFHGNVAIAAMIITMVFLLGLVMTAYRVWKVGAELDRVKRGQGRIITMESERALEIRLFSRISHIQHIANALGLLGLIGTAWGQPVRGQYQPRERSATHPPPAIWSAHWRAAWVLRSTRPCWAASAPLDHLQPQLLRGATASLCALIMDEAHAQQRRRTMLVGGSGNISAEPASAVDLPVGAPAAGGI